MIQQIVGTGLDRLFSDVMGTNQRIARFNGKMFDNPKIRIEHPGLKVDPNLGMAGPDSEVFNTWVIKPPKDLFEQVLGTDSAAALEVDALWEIFDPSVSSEWIKTRVAKVPQSGEIRWVITLHTFGLGDNV